MKIIYLLIFFIVKHFVADFILQTKWMAVGKFKAYPHNILPLITHSTIHGIITLLMLNNPIFFFIDTFSHFVIDYLKVVSSRKYNINDKEYWWLLGLDQMLHYFIYILMIYLYYI